MTRDNTPTKRFLADAGVATGMRALEIGCGGGEVTQLLAELVGPSGSVVAIDRSGDALTAARANLTSQGIGNVEFVAADLSSNNFGLEALTTGPFDVLAGRRVLMYLQDPAGVIQRLLVLLRSDSIIAFEEADSTMIPGRLEPMPAHDQATRWLKDVLLAERANPSMGFSLPSILVQAGVRLVKVRAEAVIQGQGTQYPLADLLRMMAPRLVASKIATDGDVSSLAIQVAEEAADPTRVFVSDVSFCAWGRRP